MKVYLKLRRPRVEAALRLSLRVPPAPPHGLDPRGVSRDPFDDAPIEVIDLASGPFERRFPDLAQRSRVRSRGRR